MLRLAALLLIVPWSLGACVDVGDPWYVERSLTVVPDGPIDWARDVQPILAKHRCEVCHSGTDPQAGLVVTSPEAFVAGGNSGPAIAPCDSASSLVTSYVDSCYMPPVGAPGRTCLDAAELEIMHRWIDEGAEAVYDAATCPTASP